MTRRGPAAGAVAVAVALLTMTGCTGDEPDRASGAPDASRCQGRVTQQTLDAILPGSWDRSAGTFGSREFGAGFCTVFDGERARVEVTVESGRGAAVNQSWLEDGRRRGATPDAPPDFGPDALVARTPDAGVLQAVVGDRQIQVVVRPPDTGRDGVADAVTVARDVLRYYSAAPPASSPAVATTGTS
jgi:hypothetical protein